MVGLLKTFGKGILYVIGFPFFLVALLLFGVVGLFAFIFQLLRSIIFFFTGQKFFPELPEDKELRLMREGPEKEETAVNKQPAAAAQPSPQVEKESNIIYPYFEEPEPEPEAVPEETIIQNVNKSSTIEEACFQNDANDEVQLPEQEEETQPDLSNLLDDEPEEETVLGDSSIEESLVEDDQNDLEETLVETTTEEPEQEKEEELEQYVPQSSNYSDDVLDDDDTDDDGGVDIKYDV